MRYFYVIAFFCTVSLNIWAQDTSCFLENGKEWKMAVRTPKQAMFSEEGHYETLRVKGDSIVGNRSCKNIVNEMAGTLFCTMYEENGRVYYVKKGEENGTLVFDFTLKEGESARVGLIGSETGEGWAEVTAIKGNIFHERGREFPCVKVELKSSSEEYINERISYREEKDCCDWILGVGNAHTGIVHPDNWILQNTGGMDYTLVECRVGDSILFVRDHSWEGLPPFDETSSIRPILEEGKTWIVDNDVAGGNTYHIFAEFSISEGPIAGGVQFWSVSQLQRQNGEIFRESEVLGDYFIGEKDGRLYFWNGSEQQEPALFMDFSLAAGGSIDFVLPYLTGEEAKVHLEVTAAGDTVLASSADRQSRRCLHVSYLTEDTPGNWAEVERDVWVEGIGSLKYGIMFPYYFGTTGSVQSLWECRDGETILYTASGNPDGISSQSLANCRSSHIFDLQGRELTAEPQHGVFIKGGKKVAK